jgi:hypothetical protein
LLGAELNVSAEDIDYSNKAEERLTCDYQGDDANRIQLSFLTEMLTNLQSDMIMLEMSLPNRAGILTPVDGLEEGNCNMLLCGNAEQLTINSDFVVFNFLRFKYYPYHCETITLLTNHFLYLNRLFPNRIWFYSQIL